VPAVRRPRLGNMRLTLVWFGETLDTGSVDALHEDGQIALPIRLKRHSLTVWRPGWKSVSAAEGEALHGARFCKLIDPDGCLFPIEGVHGSASAVARGAGLEVGPGGGFSRVTEPERSASAMTYSEVSRRAGPGT
jgi:hypothetical protein